MNSREYQRKVRIEEVTELLKSMKIDGEEINRKKLVVALMCKYNISRRVAVEYFDVANFTNERS